ncbi:AraC family transcriptional regulator [Duganella qianjiadongensis]|uniref:Helix-turn-helix domain-containing protein n=1 Tax=Duganella qianjiadongensis TaxID=2692176 RepID=A0ABW9VHC2_9BURK|nr:AraC family transcriptional regulator [Duganella qianjiadongensis]MYM37973.1 helix-turn-helix domain-containing protein [Duganella qianjiadongensis]
MTQPSTAGAWLTGIWELLVTIGLDPQAIFSRAGISEKGFREPHQRYSSDTMSQLWNVIIEASGDELVSLAAAEHPRPATLDLLTYTMITAPTLEGALQRFIRYIRIISDATIFQLEADTDGAQWLRLEIEGGVIAIPRQRCEFILVTILNICRWIASQPIKPLVTELAFPEPGSTQMHVRAFGGVVRFGTQRNGMLFSHSDMQMPLPASNPVLSELHERFAVDFLEKMDQWRFVPRVRDVIIRSLPDGSPARSKAAEALHVSERTLQRRLEQEGTSYNDLLDETRRDLAKEYLQKNVMALAQIAFLLGFADQSAFCRACQRWFGQSPKQLRKMQLT